MTKVVRPHFRSAAEELVTKLINGGYLQPALRDDPDAITTAIVRLKEDLRGGSDDGGPQGRLAQGCGEPAGLGSRAAHFARSQSHMRLLALSG